MSSEHKGGILVLEWVPYHLFSESVGDFNQTCIDTLLGGVNELIRFGWPLPYFQQQHFEVTCLTADPGVTSLIPARSHTIVEIDHEIISMVILLPYADSRKVVVSYK